MGEFISSVFKGFFAGASAGVLGILPYLAAIAAAVVVLALLHEIYYRKGSYYSVTKFPFISVRTDLGRYGEYLIYKNLKSYEKKGARFLFNVYIPKDDGETTEIDVMMICPKGLFVFESKNYSGWIFGNEMQKNWYQTLPAGKGKSRKESFYNPIMQNNSHIKHLKKLVGEEMPVYSVIAFSERCTLKDIKLTGNRVFVVNRNDVGMTVSKIYKKMGDVLDESTAVKIYDMLYPLTQVSYEAKSEHIANIKRKFDKEDVLPRVDDPVAEADTSAKKTPDAVPEVAVENVKTEQKTEKLDMLCPKCGGELVLRVSKKGGHTGESFYGCSNYPKCRYIKNISDKENG